MIEPIEEIFSSINFVDPLPPNSPFSLYFPLQFHPHDLCEAEWALRRRRISAILSSFPRQGDHEWHPGSDASTLLTGHRSISDSFNFYHPMSKKKRFFRKRKSFPASLHFMERKINVDTLCVIKLCVIRNYYSLDWHLHIKGYEEKKIPVKSFVLGD